MMQRLKLEILWLLTTLVLAILILLPIYNNAIAFPYYVFNVVSIFILVTFTRYIFLLQYSYLFQAKWPKAIWFFLCIPIFIYLLDGLTSFQEFADEVGVRSFFTHLSFEKEKGLGTYTKNEFVFFSIGAIIVTIILPIRLLIATWRDINKRN